MLFKKNYLTFFYEYKRKIKESVIDNSYNIDKYK